MSRVAIIGAPGAGKSTQAALLAARAGVPVITGRVALRDAIRRETAIGIRAALHFATTGEVSQESIEEALYTFIRCRAGGFVLDGFPRTAFQAARLDTELRGPSRRISTVFLLTAAEEELERRLLARGGREDSLVHVRRRVREHESIRAALVSRYRSRLIDVDASGSPEHTFERLLQGSLAR